MRIKRICMILISILFLSGCTAKEEKESVSYPTEEKDEYKIQNIEMNEEEISQITETVHETVNLCKEIYMQAEKGDSDHVVLTKETVHQMVEAAAQSGNAVTCSGHDYNLLHYEKADQAFTDMNDKKDAAAEFYVIDRSGGIRYNKIQSLDKRITVTSFDMIIDQEGKIKIRQKEKYEPYYFEYTKKGWLILEKARSRNEEMDMHIMYRIRPLEKECRDACEKYITPVSYMSNNLFLINWDSLDFGELNFNDLYDYLYSMKYKEPMMSKEKEDGIPQEEFENMVSEFFDISKEELRRSAGYDKSTQTYPWQAVDKWNRIQQSQPFPEVVECRYDEEGNLILTEEAVLKEGGTDCMFRHEVKIREEENGWTYLGNEIKNIKGAKIPQYRPRNMKD